MSYGYNPLYDPAPRQPKGIRYSRTELQHLAGAVLILTAAFAFVLDDKPQPLAIPSTVYFIAAFVAVSSGFVLHELGHKVVAQAYGHWAEFRAQFSGLGISLAIAAFAGILFAAPGAVMIMGRVTTRENGYISLVGPGINFVIGLIAFPIAHTVPSQTAFLIFSTVAKVNAILCIFNLIPLGPLDGRKVLTWSKAMWIGSMGLAVALGAITMFPRLVLG